ncbi:hypothetical protein HRI_001220800 [Hibiscus trionum]|uniref:Uncharacterized protein n=1 Tax=Hibiscus trionum TaxID=183268 RepID=A0A9W7LUB2_HIBTR|nr:hypothetical protein HRI_001220800 [Hibiscus trionum]
MALVVGQDMATRSFTRTFADINLDDINEGSMSLNFDVEDVYEERSKVFSSGTSKRKRKNVQENVEDDHIHFVVFDFLAKNELEAKAFLAKKTKHRKIWLQKFTQG